LPRRGTITARQEDFLNVASDVLFDLDMALKQRGVRGRYALVDRRSRPPPDALDARFDLAVINTDQSGLFRGFGGGI